MDEMPKDALDTFIEERIDLVLIQLEKLVPNFNVYDTKEMSENQITPIQEI